MNTHDLSILMSMWLASELRSANSSLGLRSDGQLIFPAGVRRLWVDVGVNAQTEFIEHIREQQDLFVLGVEPQRKFVQKPCPHSRCTTLWAAATPTLQMVQLREQLWDQCTSLLAGSNTNAGGASRRRGCFNTHTDSGTPTPGVPLAEMVARLPPRVRLEYIKTDAQGYDFEVMKGLMNASSSAVRGTVVSLEAQDVQDRSRLMYSGQPTLDEMRAALEGTGWRYLGLSMNNALYREVDAFFVFDGGSANGRAGMQAQISLAEDRVRRHTSHCSSAELRTNPLHCVTRKHIELAGDLVGIFAQRPPHSGRDDARMDARRSVVIAPGRARRTANTGV